MISPGVGAYTVNGCSGLTKRTARQVCGTLYKVATCKRNPYLPEARLRSTFINFSQGTISSEFPSQKVRHESDTCYPRDSSLIIYSHPLVENLCDIFQVEAGCYPYIGRIRGESPKTIPWETFEADLFFQIAVVAGTVINWRFLSTVVCG